MKKTHNPVRRAPKKISLPKEVKDNSKAVNMFKAIVFGPILAAFAISLVYVAWWGLSKLFYLLHGWMTASVVPWVEGAWPYVLVIWAFVLITSIAFAVLSDKKKAEKNSNVEQPNAFEEEFDISFDEKIGE